MFGIYRLLLALMVVMQHLGNVSALGVYAVFGFYILSGYLMTLILHSGYGYSWSGVRRFALNRFLRIYPIYWVACLISAGLVLWLGAQFTTDFHDPIYLPDDLSSLLRNSFILFGRYSVPRLSSPTWALSVELVFYVLIGLGVSRSKKITGLWFFISVIYTVAVNLMALDWYHSMTCGMHFFQPHRYHSPPAP